MTTLEQIEAAARRLAADAPPLSDEQIEAMARILATVEPHQERAA